jgi:2-oxoglutarate dehydrogenase E1 component
VIDIYCYRRHGHNETDEPAFTQPDLYNVIERHPLLSSKFAKETAALGTVSEKEALEIKSAFLAKLESALNEVSSSGNVKKKKNPLSGSTAIFQAPYSHEPCNTAITKRTLDKIVKAITTAPEDSMLSKKSSALFWTADFKSGRMEGPTTGDSPRHLPLVRFFWKALRSPLRPRQPSRHIQPPQLGSLR